MASGQAGSWLATGNVRPDAILMVNMSSEFLYIRFGSCKLIVQNCRRRNVFPLLHPLPASPHPSACCFYCSCFFICFFFFSCRWVICKRVAWIFTHTHTLKKHLSLVLMSEANAARLLTVWTTDWGAYAQHPRALGQQGIFHCSL